MAILIDLRHLGRPKVIASYLLEGPEPALVDCGPATCVDALEAGLARAGLALTDVRHVVLTHIHPDHAGAAGTLVRRHPGLQVHVSEVGAPHLVDPTRLERSARRLYGDDFDRLWGELAPVPEENVHAIGDRVLDLEAFPAPGHAPHHVAFLAPGGSCYAGDAACARIHPARYVAPALPPPNVDLEAWARTLDEIERRRPARLCLAHFGVFEDPEEHIAETRDGLARWAEWVRAGAMEDEFVAAVEAEIPAGLDPVTAEAYRQAAPPWQSFLGLRRYWDKKIEREGGQQWRTS
jgi:glyoxylase-like metal-dependent hydrolase (beta-lactamase superfamily II)